MFIGIYIFIKNLCKDTLLNNTMEKKRGKKRKKALLPSFVSFFDVIQ